MKRHRLRTTNPTPPHRHPPSRDLRYNSRTAPAETHTKQQTFRAPPGDNFLIAPASRSNISKTPRNGTKSQETESQPDTKREQTT